MVKFTGKRKFYFLPSEARRLKAGRPQPAQLFMEDGTELPNLEQLEVLFDREVMTIYADGSSDTATTVRQVLIKFNGCTAAFDDKVEFEVVRRRPKRITHPHAPAAPSFCKPRCDLRR